MGKGGPRWLTVVELHPRLVALVCLRLGPQAKLGRGRLRPMLVMRYATFGPDQGINGSRKQAVTFHFRFQRLSGCTFSNRLPKRDDWLSPHRRFPSIAEGYSNW
jgi:hypothetical protein